jgi:hypothetical protein
MLKKKVARIDVPSKSSVSSLRKKPAPVEEEVEDVTEAEPEDVVEEEGDAEEEVTPKKGKGAAILGKKNSQSGSLAKAFDSVPTTSSQSTVPSGRYEAIAKVNISQKELVIRWIWNFELCSEDFERGQNRVPAFRRLQNADGERETHEEIAIKTLRQELAIIGYPDLKGSQLEECADEINNDPPGVIIRVSYRQWQGRDIQEAEIVDECNNDVVQAYKDNVPY